MFLLHHGVLSRSVISCSLNVPFELVLPSTISPTRETPFDRISHTIFASFLQPLPDYEHTQSSFQSVATDSSELPNYETPLSRKSSFSLKPSLSRKSSTGVAATPQDQHSRPSRKVSPFFRLFKTEQPTPTSPAPDALPEPSLPLPEACQPSMAHAMEAIEVIQCPRLPSERDGDPLHKPSWWLNKSIPELGDIRMTAVSDLVSSVYNTLPLCDAVLASYAAVCVDCMIHVWLRSKPFHRALKPISQSDITCHRP